ncbi:APC family permease [Caminibacter pacificus]|uniref:Amino acid permease n=1 Tax=Caminibacter pacificus TaxID=1424653 RepID=A0AAJ4UXK4_9BACT|nr:APC family permease [Caminibacter pacificus]NPA87567.1 amino acid permease [Campylobacterota bacterium]QCI28923.1 amino acid permease [Caminibacter pacificus]ROR39514.1 amino acid:proton symporter (ABT family) [Caminibacter pacificus]
MRKIGFLEAFSIGVGGMVGGGIFAVLGLTIDLAKGAAPIAFLIAGTIALITAYSYAKLSVKFPSEGGSIEYIVQAFGNNLFSATVNNLLLVSYVIMLALYASAFGAYGSALFLGHDVTWLHKLLAVGVIGIFTFINLLGAFLTGKAEDILVYTKVAILLIFVAIGFYTGTHYERLEPQFWESYLKIITGGLIIFLAYEGFELIANSAKDVINPQKTLPRAFYASVIFVIALYVSIAVVTILNVDFETAKKAQDYVLAIAAEPLLGKLGFVIIAVAAMLSTASAINATIYGAGRAGYLIAKLGEIPKDFAKKIKNGYEGMIILGLLGVIFATSFNIENISVAGSFGFLVIFGLVNYANFKLRKITNSNPFISLLGAFLCLVSAAILIGYNLFHNPSALESSAWVVVIVVAITIIYHKLGGKMKKVLDEDLREKI